jgi:hypothetical protein
MTARDRVAVRSGTMPFEMSRIHWGCVAALVMASSIAEANPRLEVRGSSRFDAEARPSKGEVVVFGTLLDDASHTLGGSAMTVALVSESGETMTPRPCEGKTHVTGPLTQEAGGAWGLTTAPDGSFCVRARPTTAGTTHTTLAWSGGPLVLGSKLELAVDPSRNAVTLAFDPEPHVLMLDGAVGGAPEPIVLHAMAKIASEDPTGPLAPPAGLSLMLSDERGTALGEATIDSEGMARFVLQPANLGVPGPGELRLKFAGSTTNAPASHDVVLERRSIVSLVLPIAAPQERSRRVSADGMSADGAALVGSREDEGVGLDIAAVTGSGAAVPTGSVEGLIDGEVVGASPIAKGQAHLVVRWPDRPRAEVRIRYVPDVSWYLPGEPLRITVAVPATPPWRPIAILVAGLAMVGAFFLSRGKMLPRLKKPTTLDGSVSSSTTFPRLDVVAPHVDGKRVWEGRVIDAHDGLSVPGAVLVLERAGFQEALTIARAVADDAGAFTLDATSLAPGDRLAVEGRLYARMVRPAPPFGVLDVALVSRRREVLSRLIRWARAKGQPFNMNPEPTPDHVMRVAGENVKTARWAHAVERVVFGPGEVDARVETDVNKLGHDQPRVEKPGLDQAAPHKPGGSR